MIRDTSPSRWLSAHLSYIGEDLLAPSLVEESKFRIYNLKLQGMPRRSLQFKITLGALIFSGLVFLLYYLGFANFIGAPLVSGLNPVIRFGYTVSSRFGPR